MENCQEFKIIDCFASQKVIFLTEKKVKMAEKSNESKLFSEMIHEVVTPQINFVKSFGKCLTDHEGNKKLEEKILNEKTVFSFRKR